MLKMKNERGVTLVALVVTIIGIIIILSITLDLGLDSADSTNDRKLKAELQIVQQACITEYTKAKMLGYIKDDSDSDVNEQNNEENNEDDNESSNSNNNIPINFVGTKVDIDSLPSLSSDNSWIFSSENPPDEDYKKYFWLQKHDLELLGIEDSASSYIVNYYTGEVYNQTVDKYSDGVTSVYIKSVQTHLTNSNTDNSSSFVDNTVWSN